ncbi:MAG: hypothetical protein BZY88_02160 [SAR202 cluster bacterium Io17-Chloro-G9]|nr:MAG: hypothetical protein BZY88_02160 [SAR202 cluster bacterium Io17-Chloro-G9]
MTSNNQSTYVYAGAETCGLYRLDPGSSQWQELSSGLPDDPIVPGVILHPSNPEVVFAGTQDGPYRSSDRGEHWERLDYPRSGAPVWSFMFRPGDPSVMYLGTAPGEIYRSVNSGDSWQKLSATMGSNECAMAFPTRVIALAADPSFPDEIYAALEVAGVIRSSDAGDTWDEITGSLAPSQDTLDLHGIQCSAASPRTVFITTRQGPFIGPDRGREWIPAEFGQFSPITYTRDLRVAPHDPNLLYVSIGAAARSTQGALYRSRDLFRTFERVDKGISANSTMMAIAVDPRAPAHIFCADRDGQVFGSLDSGGTWTTYQLPERAKEVRGLAVG